MPPPRWRPHIRLRQTATSRPYVFVAQGGPDEPPAPRYPHRTRATHGNALLRDLRQMVSRNADLARIRAEAGIDASGSTVAVEVMLNPDFNPEALEDRQGKRPVELLSLRPDVEGKGVATILVPEGRLSSPIRRVEDYLDPSKDTTSGAPKRVAVIQSIERFRAPVARDIWTDPVYPFPDGEGVCPWEVWLRDGDAGRFRSNAAKLGIEVGTQALRFPERLVVVVRATVDAIESAIQLLDGIAELRAAPPFDADFHAMDAVEQSEWTHELEGRIRPPARDDVALCLLDSGTAWAHPLLRASISQQDCHAVGTWTTGDNIGHGTEMAGVACFGGDLGRALAATTPVVVPFRLESVKVLEVGSEGASLEHRGAIIREAPLHPEREAPHRQRVFTFTVTGARSPQGRPTSWSGAVDQVCAGVDDDPVRLVLMSAGNHRHAPSYAYPEDNFADSIQDPAQSWNALTVGAVTFRDRIDPHERPGWTAVAPVGDISPHSTTSRFWDPDWPNKPDFVMEGGNMAAPPGGAPPEDVEELGLLTTRRPSVGRSLLTSAAGTSPAAVLAGRYATAIQHNYPDLWPETVRALLVHSCRWSPTMHARCSEGTRRERVKSLLRTFGYGSPDLDRALRSAGHALTMVVEDEMQPFKLDAGKPKSNEVRVHRFPWPERALEGLGDTRVRLRVTLSYFVEPGPGERGWGHRYRYPSHGLRFAVKTAEETDIAFGKRISMAARGEGERGFPSDIGEWGIGTDNRDRGSIHSDVWEGHASRLTGRGLIAVYPVIGWWRERKHLGQVERKARYALVVSLETDDVEVEVEGATVAVDFYSEVAGQVEIPAEVLT
jgi:hypothetical protein